MIKLIVRTKYLAERGCAVISDEVNLTDHHFVRYGEGLCHGSIICGIQKYLNFTDIIFLDS